jgi:hypothetical protein
MLRKDNTTKNKTWCKPKDKTGEVNNLDRSAFWNSVIFLGFIRAQPSSTHNWPYRLRRFQ